MATQGQLNDICRAIQRRLEMEVDYGGVSKRGAAHRLIQAPDGEQYIEFWQRGGESLWGRVVGWKLLIVRKIRRVRVLRRRFAIRPDFNPEFDQRRGKVLKQATGRGRHKDTLGQLPLLP